MSSQKQPIKVGDSVRINKSGNPKFIDVSKWALLQPPYVIDGKEGEVVAVDYDRRGVVYPDVFVKVDDEIHQLDLVFVHKVRQEKPKTEKRSLSPQCKQLLKQFKKGRTVTQRSALLDFGIMALPRRIADLKEHGYNIQSEMEENHHTGQRYARYRLVGEIATA